MPPPYDPPPPPTLWDFIKPALDRHNANRVRLQRQQARQAPSPLDSDAGISAMHRIAERERERRENQELASRRSGIGDSAENLSGLFRTAPAPAPVKIVVPKVQSPPKAKKKFTTLVLTPVLPHERLNTPTLRTPTSGPTRFPSGPGIHHEYSYNCNGDTVYIHVHRGNNGLANKAHSKEGRFRYIVGKGYENDVPLHQLGTYGIHNPDTT